ncbi:MAG TPA: HAD family hydrolase [Myxococcota bacterium]|nr:HAD family hydrolase [Myxococcota bacterium]
MPTTVRAVTFDLWDTVFIDDSDEPRRRESGLPPKPQARREMVFEYTNRKAPVPRESVEAAYAAADAAFGKVWHELGVTWTVRQRLEVVLAGLSRKLPEQELAELIMRHEEMELETPPDLAPGIAAALDNLHGKYRLGVVSDAIFSPGHVLRRLLERYNLLRHFDAFAFSDEVGRSKPDAAMFEAVARDLGVAPAEIVHVGDREPNDVAGPHGVGARAVLTTVVKDRGSATTRADAVCADYAELGEIIDLLC